MATDMQLRLAFLKAIAPLERDTLLFDLTDDEIDGIVSAIATEALASPPKHKYWGAGERDCPREIKAGNGELHTLRCKVCGIDDPRDEICRAVVSA